MKIVLKCVKKIDLGCPYFPIVFKHSCLPVMCKIFILFASWLLICEVQGFKFLTKMLTDFSFC